ncbi:D-alanine--D-alanine ligase family protein [Arthrobacter sp. NEB 688]|uniref:D-alanine--D-alanine ligase family protein n=1 Tax=Arthrobacter sp. NEB 688 TaxID=904039 RepID=UPI0015664568|nr:D-alanine--D-alanine ligase family protein [Arthrobacter sp. NEB 688]QKE84219.1 D-alanine--D-alanine ligase [Arthrobacter sp. NEB 688]
MTDRPADKIRVALVFGGRSSEHAVSCATAASVLEALDRDRYDVVPVGIAKDGHWVLAADDPEPLRLAPGHEPRVDGGSASVIVPTSATDRTLVVHEAGQAPRTLGEVDVVFPLLHGPFGEDGTIQGLLDLADVRYVGSGVTASAVMMDKAMMKTVLAAAGLPIGPYVVITDRDWRRDPAAAMDAVGALTFPVFVKPARAGSSMGISKVASMDALEAAIEVAREHDPKVVVEQGIVGREIECGVLEGHGTDDPRTSELGECVVVQNHDFYDFEAKYLAADDVRLEAPADVPTQAAAEIRSMAARAFEAAGCEGLARVDFFLTDAGEVVLNEVNTMPGFTPSSMYPRMWAASGVSYPELIDELVALALERRTGLR